MEACSLLVNLRKGMQSSSEQPLVGEEHCVTTLITAAKETIVKLGRDMAHIDLCRSSFFATQVNRAFRRSFAVLSPRTWRSRRVTKWLLLFL